MNCPPLVSVIMPTYNEDARMIRASVESILRQTYENWELIILDDSTNASTRKEIDDLAAKDARIDVVRKKTRMGFVDALNHGIESARGELIARMDGDDISLPERLDRQVDFLKRNPDIDILGSAINLTDRSGVITSARRYPTGGFPLRLFMVFRSPLAHPTVMFRRKIKKDGFKYDPFFKKAEDLDFWLRLRNNGFRIANLREPLLNYRAMPAKRGREQWRYAFMARLKNMSVRYLFYDLFSIIVSGLYCLIPSAVIAFFYSRENGTAGRRDIDGRASVQ